MQDLLDPDYGLLTYLPESWTYWCVSGVERSSVLRGVGGEGGSCSWAGGWGRNRLWTVGHAGWKEDSDLGGGVVGGAEAYICVLGVGGNRVVVTVVAGHAAVFHRCRLYHSFSHRSSVAETIS